MCGRFTQTVSLSDIIAKYALPVRTANLVDDANSQPTEFCNYNLAPSELAAVIYDHENLNRQLSLARFGTKFNLGNQIGIKTLINARCETIASKPTFTKAFKFNRCVIPANGYLEWTKSDRGQKTPYFIYSADEPIVSIAALFFVDHIDQEAAFVIITQQASPSIDNIHDRMPLFVPEDCIDTWLQHSLTDIEELQSLIFKVAADRGNQERGFFELSKKYGSPKYKTAFRTPSY